jgi:hypothetical protein
LAAADTAHPVARDRDRRDGGGPGQYNRRMKLMYEPGDLAAMDPLVLMKNLDHVRMTSRRLSYILQQQVHLYTPTANELRDRIDTYVEAERQIEAEMARRQLRV